jgi:hypothetical protein
MGLTGTGNFRKENKSDTGRLTIPADIVGDSQFPLSEGAVGVCIVELSKESIAYLWPTEAEWVKAGRPTGKPSTGKVLIVWC